ncbi:MAG: acylneuraminate cytidylyltransferase family protein [Steroidobacteraceae bacterium]
MIGNKKVLALIPARGGSKGLPGKNILPVGGRPLIDWTIAAARNAGCIDRLVLSSDDDAIAACARDAGCDVPYRRPAELATDTAIMIDVVLHAIDQLPGYDVIVLLQPTSPLRTAEDIDAACAALDDRNAPACVSVSPVEHSPYWMYQLTADGRMTPLIESASRAARRQDLPAVYKLNGAVYVAETGWLRRSRTFVTNETVAYVMPADRSIDIDTAADFEAFKQTLAEQSNANISA